MTSYGYGLDLALISTLENLAKRDNKSRGLDETYLF